MLDKSKVLSKEKLFVKTIMVLITILQSFLILGSCSVNEIPSNAINKEYPVDSFGEVELSGYYNITIIKGDTPKLEISATPDDHELLIVNNDHNALEISYKKDTAQKYPIEVKIVTPNLVRFLLHGASDESIISKFSGEHLSIEINGDGALQLTGCDFKHLNMKLNGAGSINSLNSNALSSEVTVNGSGSVKTNVTQSLKAEINGVGMINYSGSPKVTQHVNGLGTIKHI